MFFSFAKSCAVSPYLQQQQLGKEMRRRRKTPSFSLQLNNHQWQQKLSRSLQSSLSLSFLFRLSLFRVDRGGGGGGGGGEKKSQICHVCKLAAGHTGRLNTKYKHSQSLMYRNMLLRLGQEFVCQQSVNLFLFSSHPVRTIHTHVEKGGEERKAEPPAPRAEAALPHFLKDGDSK